MTNTSAFNVVFEDLIARAGCTATQLSEQSGVSEASLNRYRSGARVPSPEGDIIPSLAKALARLSEGQPQPIDADEARNALVTCALAEKPSIATGFPRRFDTLCTASGVKIGDLSAATNFDASFLSRVRSGQRKPADSEAFCRSVAQHIAAYLFEEHREALLADITGINRITDETVEQAADDLATWLHDGSEQEENAPSASVQSFLEHLDAFDLNDYLTKLHFDQLKVPTVPFSLPTSKTYYQLEGMRQAELDFLRTTATSKASTHVIMCGDMPMEDMAADPDFARKWMIGLGALMKRGIRLTVVHGVNRPMQELMLGLESWIPLYMTGLVDPYYLKNQAAGPFQRLDYVSDVASLQGECIKGHHAEGRYRLEKGQREVAYQQRRMEALLSHATPLMKIYREERSEEFAQFMESAGQDLVEIDSSAFKNISISVKPGQWALIEKWNAPVMRFVVSHPRLVSAIESFTAPYDQDGFIQNPDA